MTLTSAIDGYLTLKRSLGAGLQAQASILRAFGRALGDIPLDAIAAEACASFCRGTGAPTRGWENKHQTLRGLKMFQTCGSATLSESERTINMREGSDDHPSAALPLLPRDGHCQAWSVT